MTGDNSFHYATEIHFCHNFYFFCAACRLWSRGLYLSIRMRAVFLSKESLFDPSTPYPRRRLWVYSYFLSAKVSK
uniref:hypothetical protein n=1 Tax=Prevotella sp. TaxID=59823 RepID=UPI003FEF4623